MNDKDIHLKNRSYFHINERMLNLSWKRESRNFISSRLNRIYFGILWLRFNTSTVDQISTSFESKIILRWWLFHLENCFKSVVYPKYFMDTFVHFPLYWNSKMMKSSTVNHQFDCSRLEHSILFHRIVINSSWILSYRSSDRYRLRRGWFHQYWRWKISREIIYQNANPILDVISLYIRTSLDFSLWFGSTY